MQFTYIHFLPSDEFNRVHQGWVPVYVMRYVTSDFVMVSQVGLISQNMLNDCSLSTFPLFSAMQALQNHETVEWWLSPPGAPYQSSLTCRCSTVWGSSNWLSRIFSSKERKQRNSLRYLSIQECGVWDRLASALVVAVHALRLVAHLKEILLFIGKSKKKLNYELHCNKIAHLP